MLIDMLGGDYQDGLRAQQPSVPTWSRAVIPVMAHTPRPRHRE
jgi:hypothetical protein